MKVFVTDFAGNAHFKGGGGTQIDIPKEEFAIKVNSLLDLGKAEVKPSLYPFCKYIIVPNFTQAKPGTIEITEDNQKYIRCAWRARRKGEMPFLSKNLLLPHDYKLPIASHLAVIVYSREQLEKENDDFESEEEISNDFGVVAIQANMYPDVELMTPVTMMRNAMGTEYGGNGEDIVQDYILESEKFWATHASVMFQEQHPEYIDRYQGTTAQLAEDIGNLQYDKLHGFMKHLSEKIYNDAEADKERGRNKLSIYLHELATNIMKAEVWAKMSWVISKPHIKK